MSLDITKLEMVVELADGAKRARCPACAEIGQDRKGQHLRIYPDGKFGCCVHAGNRQHRKRIFALVGRRQQLPVRVRVAAPKPAAVLQTDVLGRLGRLGRVFDGQVKPETNHSIHFGTPGTGFLNLRGYRKKNENNNGTEANRVCETRPGRPNTEKLPYLSQDGTLAIPFDSPKQYHWWKLNSERLSVAEILREAKKRTDGATAA